MAAITVRFKRFERTFRDYANILDWSVQFGKYPREKERKKGRESFSYRGNRSDESRAAPSGPYRSRSWHSWVYYPVCTCKPTCTQVSALTCIYVTTRVPFARAPSQARSVLSVNATRTNERASERTARRGAAVRSQCPTFSVARTRQRIPQVPVNRSRVHILDIPVPGIRRRGEDERIAGAAAVYRVARSPTSCRRHDATMLPEARASLAAATASDVVARRRCVER